MIIQSLSIVVPNKKCINSCEFCVSRMNVSNYPNMMDENLPFYDLYEKDYIKRLEFARDNGCNTIMLTGDSEPQQNRKFLQRFGTMNSNLSNPFKWIEMQTTGVMLDEPYLRFLRNHVGVNTISLSLSSLDDFTNGLYNKTPNNLVINIKDLCAKIKKYDFNLRLSLNLTDYYNFLKFGSDVNQLLFLLKNEYLADQVTFRVFYTSQEDSPQNKWIKEHKCKDEIISLINNYIIANSTPLEILPFGATKYSTHGMSIVIDNDCMSKEVKNGYKYLILRENCKLYSQWDDSGSLIF